MGSEAGTGHQGWYRLVAGHYSSLYDNRRDANAAAFLDRLFRRTGGVHDVLDVACGTFSIDMGLAERGYRVVGRDLSKDMIRVARRNLRARRVAADVGTGDMRFLRFPQQFDAILCLGTALNYLVEPRDVTRAFRTFRWHLRPGGLLVLDLANFDAWIDDKPKNARSEVDYRAPDGTRIAVFAFNEQRRRKTIHIARFLSLVQQGNRIDIRLDEAPLKVWRQEAISDRLRMAGFRPVEWWGDLKLGSKYVRRKSPRLLSIAVRT
ncbi:MAG: class I SAM-dependent methyltransferase [Thermoplasmata archaeon]